MSYVCLRLAVTNTYWVLSFFSSSCIPYAASLPGLSILIIPLYSLTSICAEDQKYCLRLQET